MHRHAVDAYSNHYTLNVCSSYLFYHIFFICLRVHGDLSLQNSWNALFKIDDKTIIKHDLKGQSRYLINVYYQRNLGNDIVVMR